MMNTRIALIVLCAASATACGSSTPAATVDSGTDAGTGTGTDTGTRTDSGTVTDSGTDTGVQPGTDGGTATDAGAHDGGVTADAGTSADWSCLGHVTAPTATPSAMPVHWTIVDFVTGRPLMGVTVKACSVADVMCATPLTMGTTDAMGAVALTFPRLADRFNGVMEMTGGGTYPTRAYGVRFAADNTSSLQVPTAMEATLLANIAGADLDPTRGSVIFDVHDCMGAHAAGASVVVSTVDTHSQRMYIRGALPDTTATDTDASGIGGYLNVPAGATMLNATVASGGAHIGTYNADVRAGYLQIVVAFPAP